MASALANQDLHDHATSSPLMVVRIELAARWMRAPDALMASCGPARICTKQRPTRSSSLSNDVSDVGVEDVEALPAVDRVHLDV